MYAYPPPLEEKTKEKGEKVATAVLSITAKQKKKDAEKNKKDGGASAKEEKMEVDDDKKDKKKEGNWNYPFMNTYDYVNMMLGIDLDSL